MLATFYFTQCIPQISPATVATVGEQQLREKYCNRCDRVWTNNEKTKKCLHKCCKNWVITLTRKREKLSILFRVTVTAHSPLIIFPCSKSQFYFSIRAKISLWNWSFMVPQQLSCSPRTQNDFLVPWLAQYTCKNISSKKKEHWPSQTSSYYHKSSPWLLQVPRYQTALAFWLEANFNTTVKVLSGSTFIYGFQKPTPKCHFISFKRLPLLLLLHESSPKGSC